MVPAFFNVSQIRFTCILNSFYLYLKFVLLVFQIYRYKSLEFD